MLSWMYGTKNDQIHRNLRIWSHLLKKSLMENFIFCPLKSVTFKSLRIKTSLFLTFYQIITHDLKKAFEAVQSGNDTVTLII